MSDDRKLYGRPQRRAQSHDESHSQQGSEGLGPVVPHALAFDGPATFVTTQDALGRMIDDLAAAGSFAFDSEFIGERSYESQLCLVQAAMPKSLYVVDGLAGLDLSGLWALLTSESVEKIVLAGQQDFGPCVLQTGLPPANVVDIQIASGMIHPEYPLSLGKLVQQFVGVTLHKAHTFSHWDRRPLSAMQMRYVADDVRYLPAAWDAVSRRLKELGRMGWARQESADVLGDIALYRPAPESLYHRVRGRDRLRPRQLAILRELAIVRDQAARQEDVPPRTLLRDEILMALARHPAQSLADLAAIKGLPRPVESKYGQQIVDATARAMALPKDQLPPAEGQEPPDLRDKVDRIGAAVSQFCQERSVSPALVTSRRKVARLVRDAHDGQGLDGHRIMGGWQKELLGDLLTGML